MTRAIILTITILTILASSFCHIAQAENEPILNVRREIKVGEYGMVRFEDLFTIDNTNGDSSIRQMTFGIPIDFSPTLVHVDGVDEKGGKLSIESTNNKTSTIKWFKVIFSKPVEPGSIYDFNLRMIFSKVIRLESDIFFFSSPLHPILSIKAESSNATIILPKGTEPKLSQNSSLSQIEIDEATGLNEVLKPLDPYLIRVASFNYTSGEQKILECRSLEKRIVFKTNGKILIVDNYTLQNLGKSIIALEIDTRDDAEDIMLYDFVGPLWPVAQYGVYSVHVSPRYNRFGVGEIFNFRLEYVIDQKNYMKQLDWWGRYRFSLDIEPSEDWVIENLSIILDLPKGMVMENIRTNENIANDLSEPSQKIIVYDLKNVNHFDPEWKIDFDYKYLVFWATVEPLGILLMIEIVAATLLITYSMRRPFKPVIKVPIENIRKFVNLQDEKINLRLELEKRDEEFMQGRISKHEYQRRKRFIEIRVSELNRTLFPVKNELRRSQPRYAEIILRIEKAESEIDALRVSKFQIRSQYRSGRIIKEAYDSLIADIDKRIDRAKETLDSMLITMREETR